MRRILLVLATGIVMAAMLAASAPLALAGLVICDSDGPCITSKSPGGGARSVSTSTNVTATFTGPVNPDSIDNTTFTLVQKGSTTPVEATVTLSSDGKTATLDPTAKLKKFKKYTASIKGYETWSFTTGFK